MRARDSLVLFLIVSFCAFVCCHELPKQSHGHYSFKVLQGAVNDDSLSADDVNRLLTKLHFLNCTENKGNADFRRCLSPSELYSSGVSGPLNASAFAEASPRLVYCLLPAPEKNSGRKDCIVSPKNHSELFDSFVRNFSQHGEHGITHEALDKILEDINKTIGAFLDKSKCFSAESIFEEVHEGENHEEEEEEEEEGDHHEEEEDHHEEDEVLDQEDFQKACASIIFHLVQGFCIEEGHGHNESSHSSLPSKEFFIKDLFKGKDHLSEEDLEGIIEGLGIGKESSGESDGHDGESDGHDGHDHRRKRSVGRKERQRRDSTSSSHMIYRRAVDDDHGHGLEKNGHENSSCYSLDDLLTVFGVDHSVGVDQYDLKELCPAFLQQYKSGACKSSSSKQNETVADKQMGKIWGYGFVAVTIISITSLVGVATIPFVGKKMYKKILAMLVALAVGTLAGDSILHLLPHALGLHAHKEDTGADGEHGHAEEEDKGFIWKALVVLGSIYAFFLFETLMHLCLKSKLGDHGGHSHVDVELPGPSSRHMSFKKKRKCSHLEHHEGVPPIGKTSEKPQLENGDIVLTNVDSPSRTCASPSCAFNAHCVYENVSSSDTDAVELENAKSDADEDRPVVPYDSAPKPKKTLKQSLSRRSVFSEEETERPVKKISAVAWMIIIGDTLHNISDGLAIGAAFSEGGSSGISGGISTSIAVFCHELPHELGDFAVLLTAGMSVKMALFANLMSALSCYIGLAIGIYVGQETDVRFWIFAIAGGMFLYVALVDMLPDLMHSESLQTEPVATFVYQNFGLLLGMSIMLVIALYEEDLMALKF